VFNQPGQAVLHERAQRIGQRRERIEPGAHSPQRGVDPRARRDALTDRLDVLGQPDPGPDIAGVTGDRRDDGVDGHRRRRATSSAILTTVTSARTARTVRLRRWDRAVPRDYAAIRAFIFINAGRGGQRERERCGQGGQRQPESWE
jgi:hypothetical protein